MEEPMEAMRGSRLSWTRPRLIALCSLLACGCVETPEAADARAEAHARAEPSRVAVDDFWLEQQIAAFEERPAIRPKSISLGYAGDAPLSGGVMRDGPDDHR